jgi:Domain of unknown function (DUF4388)
VALQGTLETFALPDVLRLLASTHKTGRLRLTGAGGSGSLWLADGSIVASEASRAPLAHSPSDVLFELLRFKEGDFVFDDDESPEVAGDPADIEDSLGSAESMLDEWKSIEAVVPSLDGWVSLRAELAGDEVTLDAARWQQVVAVAGGVSVAQLGEMLGLAELPVSRTVKDLVELGLVEIGDAPAGASSSSAPSHALEAEALTSFAHVEPSVEPSMPEPPPPEPPILTVVGGDAGGDVFDPNGLVIEEPTYGSSDAPAAAPAGLPSADDDMADAAEIARQLANLSPKAAKAVAAAAKATTTEEREAALAEVDDTEDPINRGLLLKFLGSVNS